MGEARINGRSTPLPDDPEALLVDVLRGSAGLTGTKLVCGAGVCGACTVLLDGVPVVSCLMPAKDAAGKAVTTVEGIGAERLHPVQKAFMALDALQCGFCTPGFVVEAAAFHDAWRREHGERPPPREEIAAALSGHLCRCGAYANILRAVGEACAGRFDGDATASPRVEARAKVTGAARYTVDIREKGQLEGLILRSRWAHARVDRLDLAPALALPGVRAAVPLLPEDGILRFVGQPIAAVAASDRQAARAALHAIALDAEALPAAIGPEGARRPEAPIVFPRGERKRAGDVSEGTGGPAPWKGNLRGPASAFSHRARKARRSIEAAREAGDPLLVEACFRTSVQQHTSLEPHAAVARVEGRQIMLHVSTQMVSHLRGLIAKRYKLEPRQVRVIAEHVGGGFGSKGGLGVESVAAIELARAAGAPVRVAYERSEELSVAGYRPGAEIKLALLATREGGLKALSLDAYGDSGAAVNSTIAGLARLIYPAEAKRLADFDVVSNLPPGSPFRGPGGPPMAFALEQAVDEAALRLAVDPIALRKRWDPNPSRQRLYDWAAGLDLWRNAAAPSPSGRFRRGVGVAAGYWLYLWELGSSVAVAVEGGRVVASVAAQDIGTGIRTVIANTVARELALEPEEIEVRIGDSALPHGPGSGGSRTTASVVPPLLSALTKLKAELQRRAPAPPAGSNAPWRALIAAAPDLRVDATRAEDERRTAAGVTSPLKETGLIGFVFGFMMRRFSHIAVGAGVPSCVQLAEVEVDTWLGHVRVLRVHTGIAVGRIAAPELARNQAAGAIIQGIGYALHEAREIDAASGHVLTAGLEDYRIPGIADTPAIEVHFDEAGFEHVAGGSVGIGEVATVPTAAAIANAVRRATGLRCHELPLRPDRLIAALERGSAP